MTIQQRLKEARENKELSMRKVASLISVAPVTISKYEKGILKPSEERFKQLSNLYGVSANYLKYGVEEVEEVEGNFFKETSDKLIITKKRNTEVATKIVQIDLPLFKQIKEIANETNLSIRELSNRLVEFGLENLEIHEK